MCYCTGYMPILEILKFPDARLKQISVKIADISTAELELSKNMLETMYTSRGIGLAAPQVGELKRLVVIDVRFSRYDDRKKEEEVAKGKESTEEESTEEEVVKNQGYQMTDLEKKIPMPLVLFNPEIIESKSLTTYDEGCLSIPGYYETIERKEWIKVKYQSEKKEYCEIETDGLLSICIQHEIDHLDGKLFLDRLSFVKAKRLKSEIKKYGYDADKDEEEV